MASTATVSADRDTRRDERLRVRTILWDHSSLRSAIRATEGRQEAGNRAASPGNATPHPTTTTPATCGQRTVTPDGRVAVRINAGAALGDRRPGFAGVGTCASVWACPSCNAKIATTRADELAEAVRKWEEQGGIVALLTLTARHNRLQKLRDLIEATTYAWSKTTSGRGWAEDQAAYGTELLMPKRVVRAVEGAEVIVTRQLDVIEEPAGYTTELVAKTIIPWARTLEVTHGHKNGWHPHVHALLFLSAGTDLEALGLSMFERWSAALQRKGLRAPLAVTRKGEKAGVDIKRIENPDEVSAGYLVKSTYAYTADAAGWEMAGGAMKDARAGNRAAFRLLRDFVETGDLDDLDLWHEFEQSTRGRRQLTWSQGFKAWLALDEVTDEEIAAEEAGDDDVQVMEQDEWKALRRSQSDILHAADWLPEEFLRTHGVTDWLIEVRRLSGDLDRAGGVRET